MDYKIKYTFLFIILLCFSGYSGRFFDLQYSHTGLPFAVFYNPALIYGNSGYTLGLDTKYKDEDDHIFRGAAVIPLGKVRSEDYLGSKDYRRDDWLVRYSKNAVSFGVMYDSYDNYRISAGFSTFTRFLQAGASFDVTSSPFDNEDNDLSVNLGVSREVMEYKVLSLTARNVVVNDRRKETLPGLGLGFGGSLHRSLIFMQISLLYLIYIDHDGIDRMETTASVNFDLTPFVMKNRSKFSVSASAGFTIGEKSSDDKIFLNFGAVFLSRPSLAAAFAGVEGDHIYGVLLYNSFGDNFDNDLYANLRYTETDNGGIVFKLDCGGDGIESWVLKIEDSKSREVRTFSGGNVVPGSIEWDGLDQKGSIVKDKVVNAQLIINDKRKNICESRAVPLRR